MDDPASAVAETPRLTRRKLLRYQLPTFCGLLVAAYVAAPLFEGAGEQSLRGGGDEEVALSYSGRQLMNSSNSGVVCGLDGVTEDQACCEPSGGAISLCVLWDGGGGHGTIGRPRLCFGSQTHAPQQLRTHVGPEGLQRRRKLRRRDLLRQSRHRFWRHSLPRHHALHVPRLGCRLRRLVK